jgi:hypothetical protein
MVIVGVVVKQHSRLDSMASDPGLPGPVLRRFTAEAPLRAYPHILDR